MKRLWWKTRMQRLWWEAQMGSSDGNAAFIGRLSASKQSVTKSNPSRIMIHLHVYARLWPINRHAPIDKTFLNCRITNGDWQSLTTAGGNKTVDYRRRLFLTFAKVAIQTVSNRRRQSNWLHTQPDCKPKQKSSLQLRTVKVECRNFRLHWRSECSTVHFSYCSHCSRRSFRWTMFIEHSFDSRLLPSTSFRIDKSEWIKFLTETSLPRESSQDS